MYVFRTAALCAASALALAAAVLPASAACTRLGFSVNDYGKDGPTADAKSLLDKYVAKWAAEHGIAKYRTGTKDVKCELFLNFIVFDEHTCRAEATVCWDGPPVAGTQSVAAPANLTAPAAGDAVKKKVATPVIMKPAAKAATAATPAAAPVAPVETGTVAPVKPVAAPVEKAEPTPVKAEPAVAPVKPAAAPVEKAEPVVKPAATPVEKVAPVEKPAKAEKAPAAKPAAEASAADKALVAAQKAAEAAERAAAAAERAAAAAAAAEQGKAPAAAGKP